MHAWIVALMVLWVVIIILILLISARAIHRHASHTGPMLSDSGMLELSHPLPTARIRAHHASRTRSRSGVAHNSVLLYPASARVSGLTEEQVAHAAPLRNTPTVDAICTICLEDVTASHNVREISQCAHFFHSACIRSWLRRSNTCPNCQCVALEESQEDLELEVETLSSKDWTSFGYADVIGVLRSDARGVGIV